MIFLSTFLDVRMSLLTDPVLSQLDFESFSLRECLPLTYDLNGFKFRANNHLQSLGCL